MSWLSGKHRLEEVGFAGLLTIGTIVFALGMAFFIIGVSIGTEPPAPYMPGGDKQMLIVLSTATMVVGAIIIRAAGKVVGW